MPSLSNFGGKFEDVESASVWEVPDQPLDAPQAADGPRLKNDDCYCERKREPQRKDGDCVQVESHDVGPLGVWWTAPANQGGRGWISSR